MGNAGLIIKNSNQEIQIDSEYRNLSLDQQGVSTLYNSFHEGHPLYGQTNMNPWDTIAITPSTLPPLCVFQPSTEALMGLLSCEKSGSKFVQLDWGAFYQKKGTINYRIYRENRQPSADQYGLRVHNAAGQLCFDSGLSYLRVLAVYTINLPTPTKQISFTWGVNSSWSDLPDTFFPKTTVSHPGISNPYYFFSSTVVCLDCDIHADISGPDYHNVLAYKARFVSYVNSLEKIIGGNHVL